MWLPEKNKSVVLLLLLVISGCAKRRTPVGLDLFPGTEAEYAVYRTLIADTNFYLAKTVVLLDSTQAWDFPNDAAPWEGRIPQLSEETLQDYLSVNRIRVPLKNVSCPGKSCVLISSEDMVDWERLYPDAGGVVTVSRVGFNRTCTQALIYWSVYRAPEAAAGSVVLLEKVNGSWIVHQDLLIWIS